VGFVFHGVKLKRIVERGISLSIQTTT
jgi:hypothetical protein